MLILPKLPAHSNSTAACEVGTDALVRPPGSWHFQLPCLVHTLPVASHPGPKGKPLGMHFCSDGNFALASIAIFFPVMGHYLGTWVFPVLKPLKVNAIVNNETAPNCHFLAVCPYQGSEPLWASTSFFVK